jgi:hypothetical protein
LTAVLVFGGRRVPRALRSLPIRSVAGPADIDDTTATADRVIVLGSDADLAAVLTRLLRTERLHVEVARAGRWRGARRAISAAAQRVPLIRDETAQVIVGAAYWLPAEGAATIHGEAVVDDAVLFDGEVTGVRVEPIPTVPGLRATALTSRLRPRRWVTGRAAQLGTAEALVVRDGVAAPRPVRRSTFYRHTEGWLRVG